MTNLELSYQEIIVIEAALYRFAKDNNSYMSKELHDQCLELVKRFREAEGK